MVRLMITIPPGRIFQVTWLFLCLSGPGVLCAGELISSQVDYDDGNFSINVVMNINADMDKTRDVLMDYKQTALYNDNIVKVEFLYSTPSGKQVGRVEIRDCLLIFCRTLVQVQELEKLPTGDIRIHVLPDQSDYHKGEYLWQLSSGPDGITHLKVDATIAPRITIPPLIGPVLIAQKLKKRMINVITKLERLSQPDNKRQESLACPETSRPNVC